MPGTYISPAETGFYLTGTRYYDPEIDRFINADSVISGTGESVHGYNLFTYCFNNPINMGDPSGNWPKWVKTIASRVVNEVKIAVKIVTSPFKAIKASVGGGIGIGGNFEANVKNIPIEVGAVVSNSDSVVLENNRLDVRNSTSADVSLNILDVVDYSYTNGHAHSYYDHNCNCDFLNSTFGEKSSCIANKSFVSNDSTIGFSLSLYLLIGFDVSIGIDMAVWSEELISIFNESISYTD